MTNKKRIGDVLFYVILGAMVLLFIFPILFVLINSFKSLLYINSEPFKLPTSISFSGIENYLTGVKVTKFFYAFKWSSFITVGSVAVILIFTSMTAWYITRRKTRVASSLYYVFVFSMVVPFQMVMFTMSRIADKLHLSNPLGMIVLYLGFGAGLSVFMFSGFVKSIPIDIEEAALIDGCNPVNMFFKVVAPILKPTFITVAILNTMWIWNDYLLPYLNIGLSTDYKTIPVVVQYLMGSYGTKDYASLMAMLVLAIIPVIIFYFSCQKYIIKGVVAGAVKG